MSDHVESEMQARSAPVGAAEGMVAEVMTDEDMADAGPAAGDPADTDEGPGNALHLGIAEQAKVFALEGRHDMALQYYRHAMHMTVEAGDPEVFFRHYLECCIESLEQTGAYDDVLEYCTRAIDLFEQRPEVLESAMGVRDLASIHQRMGVVLLKRGDARGAADALTRALTLVKGSRQRLPLAETLVRWAQMGYRVDAARIESEQQRTGYYTVRPETVHPERAIRLPDHMLSRHPLQGL